MLQVLVTASHKHLLYTVLQLKLNKSGDETRKTKHPARKEYLSGKCAIESNQSDQCETFLKQRSNLESHSENILGVSWSTQDGHADDVLSEVYGAVSVLDRVEDTEINTLETVNAQIVMMDSTLPF